MNNTIKIYALCALLTLAACNSNKEQTAKSPNADFKTESNYANGNTDAQPYKEESFSSSVTSSNTKVKTTAVKTPTPAVVEKTPEKIIRNANVRMQVKSLRESTDSVEKTLAKYEAYISNENQSSSVGSNFENTIVIRVPQSGFENLLNEILKHGAFIDYKNITALDVTDEYVDAQTRLRTKREVLERYYDLLKRAVKISEILEVEEKARVLQEEIESMEGRLKLMNDQSAYSTITVNIYELHATSFSPTINTASRMLIAIQNGWYNLVGVAIFTLNFWPFIIIIVPLLFFYNRRKAQTQFKN